MGLIVFTGGVRSGKSAAAGRMAELRGGAVTVVTAGPPLDEEMRRRVQAHQAARPDGWTLVEADRPLPEILADIDDGRLVLVDCLGAVVSAVVESLGLVPDESEGPALVSVASESATADLVDDAVRALLARSGDTIVVTNEVGSGVVPVSPSGRLFRDALGRANAVLTDAADVAWLCVAGRCLDLDDLATEPAWPVEGGS
jgi:adenosylcobinamide kinase/adenosylcobinamide-phosphate guanylyltransferase